MDFFLGIQERVRDIRGKRAIGVRAIEVLLYFIQFCIKCNQISHKQRIIHYTIQVSYRITKSADKNEGSIPIAQVQVLR